MGRKQGVKHADNLDRAVSDGRTDLVFTAARAMSGNSSRSAAVTPLYNSHGIVQYDPTSILRCHARSLWITGSWTPQATRWTCNTGMIVSLFKSPPIHNLRNSDILDQDFSWNQIAAALLQMNPRKAPGDDGISTAFCQAATYMPANTQEGRSTNSICSCSVEGMWSGIRFSNNPPCMVVRIHCSIDKKDGDPLNPGDKRGIALSMSA
ncbi:hypothetical protein BASA83_012092 [Batrachochytrium salamandrivorans]|nr:hypothetical protein BASA83_012092 [Batrachochytrium salamandrivorans]